MSKTAVYSGARWPGSVTFRDPLYLPDALAIEEAQEQADEVRSLANGNMSMKTVSQVHAAWLMPICQVVEKWELDGLPEVVNPATFPGSPRVEAAKLMYWLIGEVMAIYEGDTEKVAPNE